MPCIDNVHVLFLTAVMTEKLMTDGMMTGQSGIAMVTIGQRDKIETRVNLEDGQIMNVNVAEEGHQTEDGTCH